MIFSSNTFLFLFLPVVLCGFFAVGAAFGRTAGVAWLTISSIVFYGWSGWDLVPLIVGSVLFNYFVHRALVRRRGDPRTARRIFAGAVAVNLICLGYFKYADFGIATLNAAFGASLPLWHVALPLGISFFTLQQISFLSDVRRGQLPALDFLRYAVCVVFFPHLIAGPIVRYAQIYRQFDDRLVRVVPHNVLVGLALLSVGLFKKVIMGDGLAVFVDHGYAHYGELGFVDAWLVALSFGFEIYFDFSGYSDMAIGMARIFNIRFPDNFDSPYRSLSVQEFWRRWHMTLSRFLRDYLYIPLGGSERGALMTLRNVAIVFLLGGLWHGANWTFVVWGALQGIGVGASVMWHRAGLSMPAVIAWTLTFLYTTLSWVFFRAPDFDVAWTVLRTMTGLGPTVASAVIPTLYAGTALVCCFASIWFPNSNRIGEWQDVGWRRVVAHAGLAALALAFLGEGQPFIYFKF